MLRNSKRLPLTVFTAILGIAVNAEGARLAPDTAATGATGTVGISTEVMQHPAWSWTLGGSLSEGLRSAAGIADPAASSRKNGTMTLMSLYGSVTRPIGSFASSDLTGGVAGSSEWGEFLGDARVWQTAISAPFQLGAAIGSQALRVSAVPQVSTQVLAGAPFSTQYDLGLEVAYGGPAQYAGATIRIGSTEAYDEVYSTLNGPSRELKLHGGKEIAANLLAGISFTSGIFGLDGESLGGEATGTYSPAGNWTYSLGANWFRQILDGFTSTYESLSAQVSYKLSAATSVSFLQYFAKSTPHATTPLPLTSGDEVRSLISVAVALGNQ